MTSLPSKAHELFPSKILLWNVNRLIPALGEDQQGDNHYLSDTHRNRERFVDLIGCHCKELFSSRYAPGSRDKTPNLTPKYLSVTSTQTGGTSLMSCVIDRLGESLHSSPDTGFPVPDSSGAVLHRVGKVSVPMIGSLQLVTW